MHKFFQGWQTRIVVKGPKEVPFIYVSEHCNLLTMVSQRNNKKKICSLTYVLQLTSKSTPNKVSDASHICALDSVLTRLGACNLSFELTTLLGQVIFGRGDPIFKRMIDHHI